MKNFEELDVFQRAVELTTLVYGATRSFPVDERFGLTSQIRRAAVSVVSDIAEGQGRLTRGEWRQFLSQARGSLFEVQAQAIIAEKLGFLDEPMYRKLRSAVKRVAMPLAGLIAYVRSRERPTTDHRQPTTLR